MFHRFHEKFLVTTPAAVEIRKTALNSTHRRMGAKMVNFGGWDMPLEYSGILAEHVAMRTRGRPFRRQPHGRNRNSRPGALDLVQWVTCNDAAKLAVGQAHYSGLMTDRRHVRGRSAGSQDLRHALFALRECGQSGRRFSTISSRTTALMRSRKCRPAILAARHSRPAGNGHSSAAHARGARLRPLLSLHVRRRERRRLPYRADRLHWRRRFRNLFRSEYSEKLWNDLLSRANPPE